jgi:hypothetical protein
MSRLTKDEVERMQFWGADNDTASTIGYRLQKECVLLLMEIKEILDRTGKLSHFEQIFGKH